MENVQLGDEDESGAASAAAVLASPPSLSATSSDGPGSPMPAGVAADGATPAPVPRSAARIGALAAANTVAAPFRGAVAVAKRGRQAFSELRDEIRNDDSRNVHSALQSRQFSILDVYHQTQSEADVAMELQRAEEEERRVLAALEEESSAGMSCGRRLCLRLKSRFFSFTSAPSAWIYLIALGVLASITAFFVDGPVGWLLSLRGDWVDGAGAGGGFIVWVVWCVLLSLAAAWLGHVVPLSEGSGIPQMKSILAGTALDNVLTLRVGLAKGLGLIAAQSAGLSIGKEGPFVHITSVLASKLWEYVPYFRSIARNETLRRHMLSAAVAAGVVGVFGTPVSSVLFSIEVTASFFPVSNYWRCFVAAIVCRLSFDVITVLKSDTLIDNTAFPDASALTWEVFGYATLGIFCGLLGSAFVYVANKARIARRLLMTTATRRYVLVGVASCLCAALIYSTPYLRLTDRDAINALFSTDPLVPVPGQTSKLAPWRSQSIFFALPLYFCARFFTTVTSISLPIACGLFIPLFTMGAALGRLWGELLALIWPDSITPGIYAVVGAAALTSGATQTVSTAVVVFELTGQITHLLPVLLGTLVAYSVSGIFTISVYDMMLVLAGLPYLPRVLSSATYGLSARDVMHTDLSGRFLTLDSSYAEAKALLESEPLGAGAGLAQHGGGANAASGGAQEGGVGGAGGGSGGAGALGAASAAAAAGSSASQLPQQFAVVTNARDMVLVGSVSRGSLEALFRRKRDAFTLAQAGAGAGAGVGAGGSSSAGGGRYTAPDVVLASAAAASGRGGGGVGAEADAERLPLTPGARGLRSYNGSGGGSGTWDTAPLAGGAAADGEGGQEAEGDGEALTAGSNSSNSSSLASRRAASAAAGAGAGAAPAHVASRFRRLALAGRRVFRSVMEGSELETFPDSEFDSDWLAAPVTWAGLPRQHLEGMRTCVVDVGGRAGTRLATAAAVGAGTASEAAGAGTASTSSSPSASGGSATLALADALSLDPAPFQLPELTPLPKLHYLFAIALFPEVLITRDGRLAGLITKEDLGNPRRLSKERLAGPSAAGSAGELEDEGSVGVAVAGLGQNV